jgi:hypothetical protein
LGGRSNASKKQCSDWPLGALIWINEAHVANVSPSIAIVLQILSKTTLRRILSHGDPCRSEAEQSPRQHWVSERARDAACRSVAEAMNESARNTQQQERESFMNSR